MEQVKSYFKMRKNANQIFLRSSILSKIPFVDKDDDDLSNIIWRFVRVHS